MCRISLKVAPILITEEDTVPATVKVPEVSKLNIETPVEETMEKGFSVDLALREIVEPGEEELMPTLPLAKIRKKLAFVEDATSNMGELVAKPTTVKRA